MKFEHKVSRGSKFNQIYIPTDKEKEFEPGDLVEVRLLKKEFYRRLLFSSVPTNLKIKGPSPVFIISISIA